MRRPWRGAWRPGGVPLNTAVTGTRTLVRTIVGIVMLPLLVHRIGADRTGLFVFATTLTGYFTAIELGLGTSVTKYVAEYRATGASRDLNGVLRGSLLLMAGIGLLVALGLAIFAVTGAESLFDSPDVRSDAVPTMLVAAATSIFYWPSRLGTAALEGLERYDQSAAIQIVSSIVTLGALYVATGETQSVAVLTAIFGALVVLEGVAGAALAWRHLGLERHVGRWLGAHLKPALGLGGALFVIGVADTVVYAMDRTIVAAFVGAGAIVAYEVALRPHNGVRAVATLAGGALVGTVSRLAALGNVGRLRELVLTGSLIGVLATTPVAITVIVLAHPFVSAWLGPEYERYAVYVQIFVSYWVVHSNTGVLGAAITGVGRMRVFVWITVIGALATGALSIALTIAWGTVGVIWGTVIPALLGVPVWMHYALRHMDISWREYGTAVLWPGYRLIAVWTAIVVAADLLLDPHGILGVLAFGAAAELVFAAMALPLVRERWRSALAVASGAPQPVG